MKKKLLLACTLLLAPNAFLAIQDTLEQRIDSLARDNNKLKNQRSLVHRYIWGQHCAKITATTTLLVASLVLNSQLSKYDGPCEGKHVQTCIDDAGRQGALYMITTLSGVFLLAELFYLFTTFCLTQC